MKEIYIYIYILLQSLNMKIITYLELEKYENQLLYYLLKL